MLIEFAERIEIADSGSYYDDEVLRDMLMCDWERLIDQAVVCDFIARRHMEGDAYGNEAKTKSLLNFPWVAL